jgi:preprotein translocase subunit SecF
MKTNIDFVGKRYYGLALSFILIVTAIVSLSFKGLNLGIDFTGGTLIEVGFEKSIDLKTVRDTLKKTKFTSATVQYFGDDKEILIRLEPQKKSNAQISSQIIRVLANLGKSDIRRVEFVGPKVGEELTNDGGLAMLYALIGILIYVAFRFQYRFSLGSIVALIHDVIITLGLFSLLNIEFDLTVLAAILAIIGYSLNDTIVVFDRIRENFIATHKADSLVIVNEALNQTLSRTLMTSITTILVLLSLFFLGGEIIHGFATALLFGVIIGTYSSIYIASTVVLAMGITKEHLIPSEKERKEIDNRP